LVQNPSDVSDDDGVSIDVGMEVVNGKIDGV